LLPKNERRSMRMRGLAVGWGGSASAQKRQLQLKRFFAEQDAFVPMQKRP
jgi:hypothetical protein